MKRFVLAAAVLGCASSVSAQQAAVDHSAHMHEAQAAPAAAAPQAPPAPQTPPATPGARRRRAADAAGRKSKCPGTTRLPPGTADHAARALKESSRHGEWADIKMPDGVLKAWVVYPERAQKAGVVLVIHDIRGMSDMARAMGDQLAQDGFIAVVPDFLSGKGPNGGGTESLGADVGKTIQGLTPADVVARLNAAMEYGKKLPASNGKTGVVGFCWGGARSFGYAAAQPALNAAVVYYGDAPGSADSTQETTLANVKAPVLGPLCRQRRAHQRDPAGHRSGDEEAGQELRAPHLRGRRPRVHVLAGRRRRGQPEGGAGVVAGGAAVLQKEPSVEAVHPQSS